MLLEKPYFLKCKEWYIENPEWMVGDVPCFLVKGASKPRDREYILTDKAPQKAIDSYNEYYEFLDNGYIDIRDWSLAL